MTTAWLLLTGLAATALVSREGTQRPAFKASTELVLIDTQVVAKDGTPIRGLAADQFDVFIDGRRRPVVSVDFIRASQTSALASAATDSAGGSFFQIEVDSDPFVARALRETSAAYILAVQVQPEDRDGKDHFIRVTVKQRGSTVRYRRMVNIPAAGR